MSCAKCNVAFTTSKEAAKCSECASEFHATCCRIRTVAKLTKMSAKAATAWRCDECAQDVASGTSRSDSDDPTVLELLMNIKKEIAENTASNKDSFAALERSMASLHESLVEVKDKLQTVEAENAILKQDCSDLKLENQQLSRKVLDLQYDMADLQQYSRNHNLEICGMPMTTGEEVYEILRSVARAIGIPYIRQEISTAHRLPAPKDKRFHPSIVVQFVSRSTRATWLAAAKQKKLKTTDLAPSLPQASVFVNEHLTPHNKAVLGRAKSLVKQGKLAFAWTRDGKILVRKTAGAPAQRVWTSNDLDSEVVAPGVNSAGGEIAVTANTS